MKTAAIGFVGLFFSGLVPGCEFPCNESKEECARRLMTSESPPLISEAGAASGNLDWARRAMIQEASYAMWGNHFAHDETSWPLGTTYANFPYTAQNLSAWDMLMRLGLYENGNAVSCKGNGYLPCSTELVYGAGNMPYYTCQGYCPAGVYRGGQCKSFVNLVAYGAGICKVPGNGLKALAHDTAIEDMPRATYRNLRVGDVLRRPTSARSPHALVVVRILGPNQIIVFDSNWVGGPGREIVGSHEMSFDKSNTVRDLGTYRVLNYLYDQSC